MLNNKPTPSEIGIPTYVCINLSPHELYDALLNASVISFIGFSQVILYIICYILLGLCYIVFTDFMMNFDVFI